MARMKKPVDRTSDLRRRLLAADRPRLDSWSRASSLLGGCRRIGGTICFGLGTSCGSVTWRTGIDSPPRSWQRIAGVAAVAVLAIVGDRSGQGMLPPVRLEGMALPPCTAGFWEQRSNCRRYLDWLGAKLGYRCLDDWYGVSFWDFERNKGTMLVNGHQGSPALVVMGLIPRREWCEWKFLHVPPGFWEVTENRHRYLRWLGRELGLRRPTDWYRVHVDDIKAHFGEGLCGLWSLYELLSDFLPQLDWDRQNRSKPLGVDQILQWADAFFAEHGEWPMCSSGPLREPIRPGLPSTTACGVVFAACLAAARWPSSWQKHRGVRVGRTPPRLSEDQVLAWADAYFAAHRKWPARASGPIAGTREIGVPSPAPCTRAVVASGEVPPCRNCWPSGVACETPQVFRR